MSEDLLVSVATGMRPKTSEIALKALDLSLSVLPTLRPEVDRITVHVGTWDGKVPSYLPASQNGRVKHFNMDYGVKPEILNESLRRYGATPSWWVTLDDDTIVGENTLPGLMQISSLDVNIGLLGAWNDHSEREPARGVVRKVGDHDVQYDDSGYPFCVGGALHLIPGRVLDRIGPYADQPRHEDAEYTDRVRLAGFRAVLVRTVPVAVLPDDNVVEGYRDRIKAMHYGGYDPRVQRKYSA